MSVIMNVIGKRGNQSRGIPVGKNKQQKGVGIVFNFIVLRSSFKTAFLLGTSAEAS